MVIVFYFYLVFHKELATLEGQAVDIATMPEPKSAILDKKGFIVSSVIFFIAVVLLVTHAMTGLTVATIGVGIAVITIITTAMIAGGKGVKEIMSRVDYQTLLFFIGLFIVVGGLEQTGILVLIANGIEVVSGGNFYIMIAIIIWVSGVASAFIDNIPFAATMVPVISSLAATAGIPGHWQWERISVVLQRQSEHLPTLLELQRLLRPVIQSDGAPTAKRLHLLQS